MTVAVCQAEQGETLLEASSRVAWWQATLLGERITGRGVVQALDHAVGVPLWEIEPLLGALVSSLVAE